MTRLRLLNGIKLLAAFALSTFGVTTPTSASESTADGTAWDLASTENTVQSLSGFILAHPDSDFVDEAFCSLFSLDSAAAESAANSVVSGSYYADVDFGTCSSSASARLVNI